MADRFLIAPFDKNSGLRSNFKPWLIPDQAFSKLNNAYVWRGRIRKRFGSRWITNTQEGTRLRVAVKQSATLGAVVGVGITDPGGNATGNVPAAAFVVGDRFTIGGAEYLVVTTGGVPEPMSQNIPTTTATADSSNGQYVFAGAPANQIIYFYDGTSAITDGSGDVTTKIPGDIYAVGQMFSIGTQYFTVTDLGTPSTMLISGTATLAQFNTTTGIVTITGAAANTQLYFYPATPVMGLLTMDTPSYVNEPTIAFDTQFAYNYIGTGWERIDDEANAGAATWQGTNSDFFYGVTWVGDNGSDKVFFVTNFNQTETSFMRYLDGNKWYNYRPQLSANPPSASDTYLFCAKILTIFHNHVIALNTWEGTLTSGAIATNTNYQNRVLWSAANESPTNNNPTAWRQDIPGKGSGLDAATTEAIIGSEFVQDRLIVYFERSTWELVYTGNSVQPFEWQQIEPELGAESTFSIIPIDKTIIGVATTGIHACNGIAVQRIDQAVPELIDDIANDHAGAARVYGIRDYTAEMIYWAYPDVTTSTENPFPNRVLLYNYVNNTWATNDDTITCFGYFQQRTGVLWDSKTVTWNDAVSWNTSGNTNVSRVVMAGNQEGFTYIISQDLTYNAPSLQITDITTLGDGIALSIIDHCIKPNTYILIQNVTGSGQMTELNGVIFQVLDTADDLVEISRVGGTTGTYTGGGTVTLISNIEITTKEYSFYLEQGRNSFVNKVDFMVKRTDMGQIGVQFRTSTNTVNLTAGAASTGAIVGNGTLVTTPYDLYPYEATSERLVHPFGTSVSGEFVQMTLTFTPSQLMSLPIMQSDFQLHSMIFYATPTSRLQ